MSGISKRTVYYDVVKGVVRFFDWAEVTTGLGAMAEPCPNINQRVNSNADYIQFDPEDQIARIDRLDRRSLDDEGMLFSNEATCGGALQPRKGK